MGYPYSAALPPWRPSDSWGAQSAPPIAAAISPDNPPFRQRVPVSVRDPARPIYGVEWQYGFVERSGGAVGPAVAHEIDRPPPIGPRLSQAAVSRWEPQSWGVQRSSLIVQPGITTSIPPGVMEPPDPAAWGLWAPWEAQSRTRYAAVVALPPPPQQPPRQHNAAIYAAIGVWTPPEWSAQRARPVAALAGSVPAPFYLPYSTAPLYALALQWQPASWAAQRSQLATPPPLPPGDEPPGFFYPPELAQFGYYDPWPAQRASRFSPLIPHPRVDAPKPTSFARLYEVARIWEPPSWPSQRGPIIVSVIPPPPVNPPPVGRPSGWHVLQDSWLPPRWDAQTAEAFLHPWSGELLSVMVYKLVNAGLEPYIIWKPDPTVPYGFVISVDPPIGTTLPEWTPVTVYASSGPPNLAPGYIATPDCRGLMATVAADEIAAANLSLGAPEWVVDNSDGGTVLSQQPQPGALVLPGTIVTLTLSMGPNSVAPTTTVPS